jgi:hypothetical protein
VGEGIGLGIVLLIIALIAALGAATYLAVLTWSLILQGSTPLTIPGVQGMPSTAPVFELGPQSGVLELPRLVMNNGPRMFRPDQALEVAPNGHLPNPLDLSQWLEIKPPPPPPPPPPPNGNGGGNGNGNGGGNGHHHKIKPPPPPPKIPPRQPCDPKLPPPPIMPQGGDGLSDSVAELNRIIYAIAQQLECMNEVQQEDCCVIILNYLPQLTLWFVESLQQINIDGGGGGSTTVNFDLKPLVDQTHAIAQQLYEMLIIQQECCTGETAALSAIARNIATAGDPKPIVDAIDRNTAIHDVPQNILDKLFELGYLDPAFKPLLQGAPADWVDAVETAGRWVAATVGVVAKAAAGDPPTSATEKEWRAEIANKHGGALALIKDIVGIPPDAHVKPLSKVFGDTMRLAGDEMEPVIAPLVDEIAKLLTPPAPGTHCPGDVGVNPDRPIATAVGFALGAEVAAYLASFAGIDAGEPLAKLAELMAAAIGFEQLRDVKIGPLVREGIGAVAEMQAKRIFRQTLPGYGLLAQWNARGIMSEADARKYMALNGLCDALQNDALIGAQGGLNPRMLLQLVNTGLFTDSDIQDELRFAGVRPSSQHRLIAAAPYLATRGERDALRSTLKHVFAQGLFSEPELRQRLDAIEHNYDRTDLVVQDARYQKLIRIVADLEAEYTTLFTGGAVDDATYRNLLAGLQLQPDMIDAIAAKAEARANAALIKREIADTRALQKATTAAERRAAVQQFRSGRLTVPQLTAALAATALTPTQIGAVTAIAEAQRAGNTTHVYGMELPPDDAQLLRSREAALTDQRKRNMITDQQYGQQLRALKIPEPWINALRAQANALLSPKTAAFVTPVNT